MKNVVDGLPEGTQILEPAEWFDDAMLGYAFNQQGGVSACYAAEVCVSVVMDRMGVEESNAADYLAKKVAEFTGHGVPIFVWGFGAAPKEKPQLVLVR